MPKTDLIYKAILLTLTVIIWKLMYQSQFEEYDDNIASFLLAFIISIVSFLTLVAIWFWRRQIIKRSSVTTVIFMLSSSPISVILVLAFYTNLFGRG